MTTYTLRDKNGIAKAILPATMAFGIFELKGEWKTAHYERGKRSQFVLGSDSIVTHFCGGESLTTYLWTGDKVILD